MQIYSTTLFGLLGLRYFPTFYPSFLPCPDKD